MQNSEITRVRKVKGGKYEIELTQVVLNPTQPTNVAALLNASDERFKQNAPKPRKAWMAAAPADLKAALGVDVETLTYDAQGIAVVSIVNPRINGERLVIRVVDSFKPNFNNKPKQTVRDGVVTIFTKGGKPIYSHTEIVGEKHLSHMIINRDDTMTAEEFAQYMVNAEVLQEDENLAATEQ